MMSVSEANAVLAIEGDGVGGTGDDGATTEVEECERMSAKASERLYFKLCLRLTAPPHWLTG